MNKTIQNFNFSKLHGLLMTFNIYLLFFPLNLKAQIKNDVLNRGLFGPIQSIKSLEYIIEKNDTIVKKNSQLNEEMYFNRNGQYTRKNGFEIIEYKFDKNNRKIEEVELDEDNKLITKTNYYRNNSGNIYLEVKKDDKNEVIRQIDYKYNDKNKLISSENTYPKDGLRYESHNYKYNENGFLIEDEGLSSEWADITMKYEYFPNGNLWKSHYYGDGDLEYTRIYNNKGVEIKLLSYNKNGLLSRMTETDDNKNLTKSIIYKEDGIEVEEEKKYLNKYNLNGKIISSKILDSNNKLINENHYEYDKKGYLIYSDEASHFHGSNSISTYKYNKWGKVVYEHFTDYAERGSYRVYKYDVHQNEIFMYEDNGKGEGESGHEHYTFLKEIINYYPYKLTHKIIVKKAIVIGLDMKSTNQYLVNGDLIHVYYQGNDYSAFEYKTKSGTYVSGYLKNSYFIKLK